MFLSRNLKRAPWLDESVTSLFLESRTGAFKFWWVMGRLVGYRHPPLPVKRLLLFGVVNDFSGSDAGLGDSFSHAARATGVATSRKSEE
jgi:hypothetical protein